jgi:hypothetical protein
VRHGDVAAFLTRRFDGFFNRRCGEHLRILRTGRKDVEAGYRGNPQSGSDTNSNTG